MCMRILRLMFSYNRYTAEVQYTTIKFAITYNLMRTHTHVQKYVQKYVHTY